MASTGRRADNFEFQNAYKKLRSVGQRILGLIRNVHPYSSDDSKDQDYQPSPQTLDQDRDHNPEVDAVLVHGDVKVHCDLGFVYEDDSQTCGK